MVGVVVIYAAAAMYRSAETRKALQDMARTARRSLKDLPASLPALQGVPADKPTGEATTSGSPAGTTGVAADSASPLSHAKAARTLILLKQWDEAVSECDLGLKIQPDNADLQDLRRKASAKGLQWGVVRNSKASVFDHTGRSVGSVPIGTILNVHEIKKAPRDVLAYCTKPADTKLKSAFFVRVSDLNIRSGPAADAPQELLDLASRQVSLKAKLAAAKTAKTGQLNSSNPHSQNLQSAITERKAYWAKVEELKKSFDKATGDGRMKIHDQLRSMRGQDVRVEQAYEQARKQYDAWEAKHPSTQEADSDVVAMETEIAGIEDAIERLEASP